MSLAAHATARPLRVLHAPDVIGGNAPSLARAERAVGLQSVAVSLAGDRYGYGCDELLWEPGAGRVAREIARWKLFRRALHDFDVIHFNFGQSILTWGGLFSGRVSLSPVERGLLHVAAYVELVDLPALRRAGKVIAVTYQGDDARQGDYCREHFRLSTVDGVPAGYYSPWSDRRKRERIARFCRYADLVYALNPDLLHVLPPQARFVPYASVDMASWSPTPYRPLAGRPPVVVHAPSHRGVKGTEHIVAAVARLQAEGVAIDFQLVEGLTNAEARRRYESADLVIDQLLAGWYGGLAVEVMALGKPVVAYLRAEDLAFLPEAMRSELPIVDAEPATIYTVLKRLLGEDESRLAHLGERSRRYVERWHDPLRIAARLKADYEAVFAARDR
jgi:glycosyltransferase involved in cell wall biosynthesis